MRLLNDVLVMSIYPCGVRGHECLAQMIPKLHWIGINCRTCKALRQFKQANDSGQVDSVEIFVVWNFDIRFEATWVVLMLAAVIRHV